MKVLSSSADLPVTMDVAQFPVGKLCLVGHSPGPSMPDCGEWISTYIATPGKNLYYTKKQMREKLLECFKEGPITWMLENFPFSMLVDSQMVGQDFYDMAEELDKKEYVWLLQIMARGVEAWRQQATLSEIPMIHPDLGVAYDGSKHSPRTTTKTFNYQPIKLKGQWYYLARHGRDTDLIALL